jgi:hypothetical protein
LCTRAGHRLWKKRLISMARRSLFNCHKQIKPLSSIRHRIVLSARKSPIPPLAPLTCAPLERGRGSCVTSISTCYRHNVGSSCPYIWALRWSEKAFYVQYSSEPSERPVSSEQRTEDAGWLEVRLSWARFVLEEWMARDARCDNWCSVSGMGGGSGSFTLYLPLFSAFLSFRGLV